MVLETATAAAAVELSVRKGLAVPQEQIEAVLQACQGTEGCDRPNDLTTPALPADLLQQDDPLLQQTVEALRRQRELQEAEQRQRNST